MSSLNIPKRKFFHSTHLITKIPKNYKAQSVFDSSIEFNRTLDVMPVVPEEEKTNEWYKNEIKKQLQAQVIYFYNNNLKQY